MCLILHLCCSEYNTSNISCELTLLYMHYFQALENRGIDEESLTIINMIVFPCPIINRGGPTIFSKGGGGGFWAGILQGGFRVQVRGNFHILTSKKKPLRGI